MDNHRSSNSIIFWRKKNPRIRTLGASILGNDRGTFRPEQVLFCPTVLETRTPCTGDKNACDHCDRIIRRPWLGVKLTYFAAMTSHRKQSSSP